jgi:hypothetical protein
VPHRLAHLGALLLVVFTAEVASSGASATEDGIAEADAVRSACDLAHSIAAATPGASIERSTGVFADDALPHPVPGCRLALEGVSGADALPGDVAARLRAGFTAGGWEEMLAYGADGKDAACSAAAGTAGRTANAPRRRKGRTGSPSSVRARCLPRSASRRRRAPLLLRSMTTPRSSAGFGGRMHDRQHEACGFMMSAG